MLIMFIISIIASVITDFAVIASYENRAVSSRSVVVKSQCDMLNSQLSMTDYLKNPSDRVINGQLEMLTNIYGGRIQVIDSDFRVVKDTYNLDNGKYMISPEVIDCFNGSEITRYVKENDYVEMTVRIVDQDSAEKDIIGVMLVSFSTKEIENNAAMLRNQGLFILGIVVLLILVFGFIMSGFLVRPFRRITSSLDAMTASFLEQPISVYDYSETRQISDAFNRLQVMIRNYDESRSEFVSNVAHELKTPLTSMKVLADSLNMNPEATLDQYKEFMTDISEEIERENNIISDLLSLVVLDKKAADLNIEETNINELIELVIKRLGAIAKKADVELSFDSFRTVTAEVDPTKITLVFSNIIENAIKYNRPEGGWVKVSLNADMKYFYVTIADSGIGIPEESIDHIFERFYRIDKSHSREIGGTGLGLAISKSIIVMHKGAVRVTSKEGRGTTFSIRIPLSVIN